MIRSREKALSTSHSVPSANCGSTAKRGSRAMPRSAAQLAFDVMQPLFGVAVLFRQVGSFVSAWIGGLTGAAACAFWGRIPAVRIEA